MHKARLGLLPELRSAVLLLGNLGGSAGGPLTAMKFGALAIIAGLSRAAVCNMSTMMSSVSHLAASTAQTGCSEGGCLRTEIAAHVASKSTNLFVERDYLSDLFHVRWHRGRR